MKNITNNYLDKAKNSINAISLIDNEATREIIAKSENGHIKSNYSKLLKTKGVRKMITYSSLIGLFTAALLFLFPANHPDVNNIGGNHPKAAKLVNNEPGKKSEKFDFETAETGDKNQNKKNYENQLGEESPKSTNNNIDLKVSNENSNSNFKIEFSQYDSPKVEFPLIIVNGDELSKLGIIKAKNRFEFRMFTKYNLKESISYAEKLEPKNYPTEGVYREEYKVLMDKDTFRTSPMKSEITPFGMWEVNDTAGIKLLSYYNITFPKQGGKLSNYSSFDCNVISPRVINRNYNEVSYLDTAFCNNYKNFDYENAHSPVTISVEKSKAMVASKLLPIMCILNKDSNINITILWYLPTQKLISALPERYRNFVTCFIKPTNYIDCTECPDYNVEKPEIKSVPPIGGFESLELTPEELKKLDITFKDGKWMGMFQDTIDFDVTYKNYPDMVPMIKAKFIEMGYDTAFRKGFMRTNVEVDLNQVGQNDLLKYGGWDLTKPSMTLPIGVSEITHFYKYNKYSGKFVPGSSEMTSIPNSVIFDGKKMSEIFTYNDEGRLQPLIDRILPVHILLGTKYSDDSSKINYGDIYFMFYVNKEFAELLPDRYKIPLLRELKILSDIENGTMEVKDGCEALKGEKSYFGLCSMTNEIITKVNVFPNPLKGSTINISFNLKENGNISINLYDLSGKFIRKLMDLPNAKADEYSLSISSGEALSDGLYMINISDSKGNNVIQKIMVKN